MKRLVFLIMTVRVCMLLQAQTITVKDRDTGKPIARVLIYTDSINTTTNNSGQADINIFKTQKTIFFQHTAYHTAQKNYSSLLKNRDIFLNPSAINLQEVLVAANKWEQDKKHIPSEILGISAKEISFHNPQTSADALANSGKVFVQKSQLGGGSPIIRGFSANSVLIVIDGVRMNNAIFRSGNLQNTIMLTPNSMESVEVVFGPGSVIYGSDALGGVIDFHTKDPQLARDTSKRNISANLLIRYSSANSEQTAHANFSYASKCWGVNTSLSFSDFDHLQTGSVRSAVNNQWGKRPKYIIRRNGQDLAAKNSNENLQVFSAYSQANLLQKFVFKPNKQLKFTYMLNGTTSSDIPRYDRLIEYNGDELKFAEWYYGPQKWLMNALKITYNNLSEKTHQLRFTLAHQFINEQRNDRKNGNNWLRTRTERVNVYTFNLDAYKILSTQHHELFYGLEYVQNNVHSDASAINIENAATQLLATRYPSRGSQQIIAAFYSSYKWYINSYCTFVAGLRLNYTKLQADFSDKTFYNFPFSTLNNESDAFNGSLGLVMRPDAKWQLNLNFSSGFRTPNVDDIGKIFDSEPGNVIVPNANLSPEYAYNADVGIQKVFFNWIKLNLSGYYTILRDAMVRRDFQFDDQDSIIYDGVLSRVQALTNTGSAYISGISVELSANIGQRLKVHSIYNYTAGRDTEEDLPLRHVVPAFGKHVLKYIHKSLAVELSLRYASAILAKDLAPSISNKLFLTDANGAYPSWWVMDLKTVYRLKKKFTLQAGVENIFDKHYRPYSWGISAPGRNFYLALRASL